jgi:hypothetical protein
MNFDQTYAYAPQRHLSFECFAVEKLAHCAAGGVQENIVPLGWRCDARRTRREPTHFKAT